MSDNTSGLRTTACNNSHIEQAVWIPAERKRRPEVQGIKAFARLRRAIEGLSTPKGIEEYLVLLSVCQTCKYMGVDFLDFLRSGEKDIHAFAESR